MKRILIAILGASWLFLESTSKSIRIYRREREESNFALRIAGGIVSKINMVPGVIEVKKEYKARPGNRICLKWIMEPVTNRYRCAKVGRRSSVPKWSGISIKKTWKIYEQVWTVHSISYGYTMQKKENSSEKYPKIFLRLTEESKMKTTEKSCKK